MKWLYVEVTGLRWEDEESNYCHVTVGCLEYKEELEVIKNISYIDILLFYFKVEDITFSSGIRIIYIVLESQTLSVGCPSVMQNI